MAARLGIGPPPWRRLPACVRRGLVAVLLALTPAAAGAADATGGTLETVRARGILNCGVGERSGYAWRDAMGRMHGFRADLCRAVAAAVLDDPEAVAFVPLTPGDRFRHLTDGTVDLLISGVTWTLSREAALGLEFTGVVLYDGQGFLAHRSFGAERLADVTDGRICVITNTTNESNLEAWIAATGSTVTPVRRATTRGVWDAFVSHACDIITNDLINMLVTRQLRVPDPAETVVFPEMISREPLSPAVRAGEPRWASIVRFTTQTLLLAEALGLTREAVAGAGDDADRLRALAGPNPEAARLLGVEPGIGAPLGLDDAWARRALAAVGNYGEVFDRNLGKGSIHKLDRGLNALWTDGGLHYPLTIW